MRIVPAEPCPPTDRAEKQPERVGHAAGDELAHVGVPSGGENFGDTSHVAQLESATAVSEEAVSRRSVNA
jgi:hypothetical protein